MTRSTSKNNHSTQPGIVAVCSSTNWGGTEKWVLRACEELHMRGRNVKLIVRDEALFRERLVTDLPLVCLPLRNEADVKSISALKKEFRENADIVILTRVRDYWLGGIAAKMACVPALLRLGVVRHMREKYFMDKLRYGKLPTEILVNAGAIKNELIKTSWINGDNINIIYNGVDVPGALPDIDCRNIKKEFGISSDEILIVGAGRLAVEKRWRWFVEAFAGAVERGLPVFGLLFGEGSERLKIEDRIRNLKLEDRFLMPGYINDVERILAAADIVVLPSENEGVSNVMLESMGRAVPVVVTASGGVTEKFEHDKDILMTEKYDLEGFKNHLIKLAQDANLRDSIGKSGYKTVCEQFTWSAMTDALETLLDRIVHEKS